MPNAGATSGLTWPQVRIGCLPRAGEDRCKPELLNPAVDRRDAAVADVEHGEAPVALAWRRGVELIDSEQALLAGDEFRRAVAPVVYLAMSGTMSRRGSA